MTLHLLANYAQEAERVTSDNVTIIKFERET